MTLGAQVASIDYKPFQTVRHINCSLITSSANSRCTSCTMHRRSLFSLSSILTVPKSSTISKFTNYRYIASNQTKDSLISLRSQNRMAQREIVSLKATIEEKKARIVHLEKMIEHDDRSVTVNPNTHQDLFSIMQHHHNEITKAFPEDSFPYIFWMSQYKAATKDDSPTGMRWNPAMIRWCVYLQQKSSTAYELIRKSKCLYLPSQRTLREYIHHNKSDIGFSNELDEQLIRDSKLESLEDHQKYVSMIADEMYIKQGLVYNKTTGDLVGYCRIGEINDHLLQLEREYTESNGDNTCTLAKTMLVLMIRGLFTSFTFPYASFATSNLTGEQMVPIFYEGIMRIERCGFKVLTVTLDGNSVNRKFMQIISTPDTTLPHKFKNPLSNNSREIFLFSDPSHLIKTARNCLANQSRNMQVTKNYTYMYMSLIVPFSYCPSPPSCYSVL